MPNISANRNSVLQQLKDSEEAAARLVAGVGRAQANWQPNQGTSWSIWQCLDHLSRTNQVYGAALLTAVTNPRESHRGGTTKIAPGWFARCFIGQMEPPVRKRYATVKKVMPAKDGDPREGLRAFVESHEVVRRVLESWDTADFNRIRFKSPFAAILRFTVGTGLLVITAHDRRHLWQAERVKVAEGYPGA